MEGMVLGIKIVKQAVPTPVHALNKPLVLRIVAQVSPTMLVEVMLVEVVVESLSLTRNAMSWSKLPRGLLICMKS